MDWFKGRGGGEPRPATLRELQPIQLYAADAVITGWVDPAGQRMTDILQRVDELAILPDGADPENPDEWRTVNPEQCLIVVPPPHVSPPELRVHRPRQAVQVAIGPYAISGTAHLKAGHGEDLFFRATHPFLPLTDAVVERAGASPELHEVVIVNLRLVESFREVAP